MNTITVIGVEATIARFAAVAGIAQEAETVVSAALAEDIADAARGFAPVDTGELRDSIQAESDRVTVGAPYAAYVEYGTSHMSAEPFLRPAADTVDDERALNLGRAVILAA
jgi:HK97 gp10 family phage protein